MRHEWPLPEDILSRVPKYATQIAEAKAHVGAKRLVVADAVGRDRVQLLQLFDYFATGGFDPLEWEGPESTQPGWVSSIYSLACDLDLDDVAEKLCVHVTKSLPGLEKFVEIATNFCKPNSRIPTAPNTIIGDWIRKYLATNLNQLDHKGYVDQITRQGGELSNILIRVVMNSRRP